MSDETVRVAAALVEALREALDETCYADTNVRRHNALVTAVRAVVDAAERPDEGEVPKRVCGDVGYGWSGEEIIEADAPRRPCISEHGDAAKCRKCYPTPAAPVEDCEHGNDVRYGCKHCDESGTVDTSSPRRNRDEGTEDEAEAAWREWIHECPHLCNTDRCSFIAGFRAARLAGEDDQHG